MFFHASKFGTVVTLAKLLLVAGVSQSTRVRVHNLYDSVRAGDGTVTRQEENEPGES